MLSILLQSTGRMVILINFKINQAYIASVLCENKEKPELKCDGKCQLNKKMAEQEETEKQLPPQIKLKELNLFINKSKQVLCKSESTIIHTFQIITQPHLCNGFSKAIFQPPDSSL